MSSRGTIAHARVKPTLAVAGLALTLVAGCGGSDEEGGGPQSQAAPPAADFPAAEGRNLNQLLRESATPVELVVSPAQQVLRTGTNRFAFGVFNVDRSQVTDAQIALYAAPGNDGNGPAVGPFPARIDTLETQPAFRSKTTVDDPDSALAAYVSEVEFSRRGPWTLAAMVKSGSELQAVFLPNVSEVGQHDDVPAVGDRAPRTPTDTAETIGDPRLLETRDPPDTMHEDDFADVLGREPVVLVFSSPSLCVSRTCGPVTDVAEQVHDKFGDRVAFIHQEPYVDNQINKGLRPPLRAFNLPGEPWIFVIDAKGIIRAEFEGPVGVEELTSAVERVALPGTDAVVQ